MDYMVYSSLGLSVCLNLALTFKLYKKHHVLTVDAKKLLSDLLSGDTLIKIQVIDPSGLFYRSPKG